MGSQPDACPAGRRPPPVTRVTKLVSSVSFSKKKRRFSAPPEEPAAWPHQAPGALVPAQRAPGQGCLSPFWTLGDMPSRRR